MLVSPRHYALLGITASLLFLFVVSLQRWQASSTPIASVPLVPRPPSNATATAGNATLGVSWQRFSLSPPEYPANRFTVPEDPHALRWSLMEIPRPESGRRSSRPPD